MQFIIATHGKMASGIFNTLELLIGNKRKILILDAYVENQRPVQERLEEMLEGVEEPIVAFTDIVGGSVNRETMIVLKEKDAYVITDFNLALLLEICLLPDEEISEERINECIHLSQKQMRCLRMTGGAEYND